MHMFWKSRRGQWLRASRLILLVCVLLAFCPGTPSFPANALAVEGGEVVVVSMGDSYSSGEGTEPFYGQGSNDKFQNEDWLAHRSEKAWPGLLGVDGKVLNTRKGQGWYFVASSGAKTNHILGTKDKENGDPDGKQKKTWSKWSSAVSQDSGSYMLPCQSDIFSKLPAGSVDYVTMTMGGNDLGFADIIETAVVEDIPFLSKGSLKERLKRAVDGFEYETKDDLLKLYDAVYKKAGKQAKIIVAGYPRLFPNNGRGVMSSEKAQLINAAVNTFDTEMRSLVAGSGKDYLRFVDVRSEFANHEADYINDIIPLRSGEDLEAFQITSSYSVHPNSEGHEAYARAVQDVLDDLQRHSGSSSSASSSSNLEEDVDVDSDVAMSLVFDVSGSMGDSSAMSGMTKLESAKKQSSDFVSSVSGENGADGGLSVRVGVCSFSNTASTDCGLSNDPDDINASISSLRADGQTNMYAGLEKGISQLMGEDGPRLMVFLSDGLSNVGRPRSDIVSLAQEAADERIKIYTIGFGQSSDIDEELLREIAEITGGEYSHEDSANISSAAVGLFATMMNARLQETYEVLSSIVGAVGQDLQVDAGAFDITKNGTVKVYLYWPGSELDMLLADPDGTKVAEGYPGSTIDTSTIPTSVTIENAKQGTWNMSVYGREVSMAEEPYYAVAAFKEHAAPASTGGGGSASNNGEGLVFVLLVAAIASIGAVFAYTRRRSSE